MMAPFLGIMPLVLPKKVLADIKRLSRSTNYGIVALDKAGVIVKTNRTARRLLSAYVGFQLRNSTTADLIVSLISSQEPKKDRVRLKARDGSVTCEFKFIDLDRSDRDSGNILILLQETTSDILDSSAAKIPSNFKLSKRQTEVLSLLVTSSLPRKLIAKRLLISEGTLRKHIEQIYRRLKVNSRVELVSYLVNSKRIT
jgi:DNA-binding CsgD family transcriptional regulator